MIGSPGGRRSSGAATGPDLTQSVADAVRLRGLGMPEQARRVLRRALARPSLDADPLVVATARALHAEVLFELGDPAGAYRVVAPLADEARRWLGADHPVTVRTIVVLATVLHELGELEQAERYYRQVDAVADPAGRAASLVRVRLALLERDRGDLPAATKRLAAAYGRHRAEFGVGDADTVHIAAQLVELHRAAGDEVAARRVLAEAHTEARAGLGEHHPLTRRLAADMAAVEEPAQFVPPALPASPPAAARSGRLRELWRAGGLRAAALGAVVVGVLMTVTGALALARGDREPAALSPPAPTAGTSGPASTAPGLAVASGAVTPIEVSVRLRDDGSTVTVSWQLSTPAAVVVALGSGAGAPLRVVTTVPRGTTSYQLRGLDPRGDYCVTVGPVDASAAVSRAATACTDRN